MTLTLDTLQEFDTSAGLAYADGDEELYREVLAMFHEQLTDEFAQLPEQLRKDSGDTLARQVHTLKGSAGSVGATRIEAVAREIDQGFKAGKVPDNQLVDALQASLLAANHELTALT
ncbi:MAG: Hpt domain-containing protein [Pseudomonadota bacterium]